MKIKAKMFAIIAALVMVAVMIVAVPVASEDSFGETSTECPGGDSCTHVASVGNTHYDTLLDAVNNAENGNTIVLEKDYTVLTKENTSYLLPENSTLDLNGKILTIPFMTAIFEGKNAIITNGTISSDANYALWIGNNINETIISINNVKVIGGINVFAAKAILLDCVVGDATGKTYYAVWGDSGSEINIEGGTYLPGSTEIEGEYAAVHSGTQALSMTISGGTFYGSVVEERTGNTKITGGTFSTNVEEFLGENKLLVFNGINYTVVPEFNDKIVAQVGKVGYTDINDALVAAISIGKDTTVTVLNDCTLSTENNIVLNDSVTLIVNKNVTLTVEGKGAIDIIGATIIVDGALENNSFIICSGNIVVNGLFTNNNFLQLRNSSEKESSLKVTEYGKFINNGTFDLKSGSFSSETIVNNYGVIFDERTTNESYVVTSGSLVSGKNSPKWVGAKEIECDSFSPTLNEDTETVTSEYTSVVLDGNNTVTNKELTISLVDENSQPVSITYPVGTFFGSASFVSVTNDIPIEGNETFKVEIVGVTIPQGESIKIKIPCTDSSNAVVHFVSDTGKEKMKIVERGEGYVVFETTHNSLYMVSYNSNALIIKSDSNSEIDQNITFIAAVCILIFAILGFAFVIRMK